MLRILLLSDIHFIHCEDDENDYRSLETAFVEAMDEVRDSGGLTQILICGDIANKGQENEYQTAEAFLKRVFELTGVTNSSDFQKLNKEIQREALRQLLDMGASVRQLQRLTGLGRGLIQRL